jgi:hypothetical protein
LNNKLNTLDHKNKKNDINLLVSNNLESVTNRNLINTNVKKKISIFENNKEEILTLDELNQLDYTNAINDDNRNICKMFIHIFCDTQIIFSVHFSRSLDFSVIFWKF